MQKELKTATLPAIKVTETEQQEINEVLEILDIPFSHLARASIRKEIASLKQTEPKLRHLLLKNSAVVAVG